MQHLERKKIGLGTAPVFLTTISTILGAILFLRFGYAAGHVGFLGLLAIIILAHLVTIPTVMAISEIATNQKVEGGGAYYMISRSFGINIGSSVGIALYLAQAISVAFYLIAFAEAFTPIFEFLGNRYGIKIEDTRVVSLPAMALLTVLMLTKGANIGIKALYFVVAILFLSLFLFFLGEPTDSSYTPSLTSHISRPDDFIYVFTIVFPAFTGIIAGLGLSGDLKNPKKSIPLGTISATIVGIIIYIFVAYKLIISASPEELANDQLIMSKIAIWGPIIPIGLAAATISSALGSIMIAPRTLQALAADNIFQVKKLNNWLAKGLPKDNEPRNSTIVTIIIAFFFVSIGSIDYIAKIITMFFLVIYGAICLISFLEHFAADPAYRPSFKSKWQFSLIGAFLSFWLMFRMNLPYAVLSIIVLIIFYIIVSRANKDKEGLAHIFQGVIFQISRKLRVFLQKTNKKDDKNRHWRPSVICVSGDSFQRFAAFELVKWISYKYGFGTYIHFINGYLSKSTHKDSKIVLDKLLKLAETSKSNVYLDTIISPSYTSAIAQVIQLPSVSGKENNTILFEFDKKDPGNLGQVIDNFQLLKSVDFDVCILGSSQKGFGYHNEIHIWISSKDFRNANLMILLGYIILGHSDWRKGQIKIFAVFPFKEIEAQRTKLLKSIKSGRLPISPNNVRVIAQRETESLNSIICSNSEDADLTIIGFRDEQVRKLGKELFLSYNNIGNTLFVNTSKEMDITLE